MLNDDDSNHLLLLTIPDVLMSTEQRRGGGASRKGRVLDSRMVATPLCAPPEHVEANPSSSSSTSTQEAMDAQLVVDLLSDSLQLLLLLFGCVVVLSLNGQLLFNFISTEHFTNLKVVT